jgi:hypothetical protein
LTLTDITALSNNIQELKDDVISILVINLYLYKMNKNELEEAIRVMIYLFENHLVDSTEQED